MVEGRDHENHQEHVASRCGHFRGFCFQAFRFPFFRRILGALLLQLGMRGGSGRDRLWAGIDDREKPQARKIDEMVEGTDH